ncbi:MAG TPA: hypothetical protein VFQ38_13835 [Longimicrobiales bacterium]|nr:hypothetical protein [Longimicrobiales bacterium]
MVRKHLACLALGAFALSACGRDAPTEVGGSLLPGGSVRTYELVLDAPSFLLSDTVVTGFRKVFGAGFFIVADRYGGAVDANVLGQWSAAPPSITVLDSAGTTRTDTLPRYIGGRLVLQLDTTQATPVSPVKLTTYRLTEAWDPASVSWTSRVDTTGAQLAWQTPGGTRGARIDTATWSAGSDSVAFRVDSATFRALTDTAAGPVRGVVVVAETNGARLKATSLLLRGLARPTTVNKDTTVTTSVGPEAVTMVSNPPPPAPTHLRVGGLPPWRSYLHFAEGLRNLTVPCPGTTSGCSIRLDRTTINYAALLLDPLPAPAGFLLEDSLRMSAANLNVSPLLPLARSPLGVQVGGTPKPIPSARFASGASGGPVEVTVTPFVEALVADTTQPGSANAPTRYMALVQIPEPFTFGFADFYGRAAGAHAPRLRLIVTVASEVQLP